MLARFANEDGGLTVVRREPKWVVLRNQTPESIGFKKRLNSRRHPDGSLTDESEKLLADFDGAGSAMCKQAIAFGIDADAETHLRLLNMDLVDRASLQLFVATLMVRTPSFRKRFDEAALPTLLEYMSEKLEEQFATGEIDQQNYRALREAYDTPGRTKLTAPKNRHLDLLAPLIFKLAMRLHLDTLVGVRRFTEPLLFTGGEPVVVFPSADFAAGRSAGELLAGGETPIQGWQEADTLLEQVDEKLSEVACLAVAIDPWTLLMMFNADKDDGGKAAYIASQVPPEGLAGVVNLLVGGSSVWLAGREDCKMLGLFVDSALQHGAPQR
jgi:hypothetical protein